MNELQNIVKSLETNGFGHLEDVKKLKKLSNTYTPQNSLIELLLNQLMSISLMSKIELGDDVIEEIKKLQENIPVPFVGEVEEFNTKMGKEWQNRSTPTIHKADADFVTSFIQEELDEMKVAVEENDIVGILDAILDITYVCLGNGALVFGLKDRILPGYAEVQRSNLSKICKTEKEAQDTAIHCAEVQGEPCHYKKIGEGWVVYRTRDNKIMKALSYSKPNLNQFFTPQEITDCL